jgi:putative Mg2+ transporter-C (MgtC) family protein
MASTALTIFSGFAPLWFGGRGPQAAADPTHVVQGIVAGIGFLGAGVIMKDGLSIRGLTTAASIWAVAAVGVLVGVGMYPAAIFFALLCALSMSLLHNLKHACQDVPLDVTLTFCPGFRPDLQEVAQIAQVRGYRVLRDSVTITFADNQPVWRFGATAMERSRALSPTLLADELSASEGVAQFTITPFETELAAGPRDAVSAGTGVSTMDFARVRYSTGIVDADISHPTWGGWTRPHRPQRTSISTSWCST